MKRILILGASGFIGQALYKELSPYYATFGTYHSNKKYRKNKQFYQFDHTQEGIEHVLKKVKPKLIISALRGPFNDQIEVHQQLIEYIQCSIAVCCSSLLQMSLMRSTIILPMNLTKPCPKVCMAV